MLMRYGWPKIASPLASETLLAARNMFMSVYKHSNSRSKMDYTYSPVNWRKTQHSAF